VDIGWHTFILYTKDYASFCNRVAGRFIHHEPNDNPEAKQRPGGIKRTIEVMKALQLPYDEMIWTGYLNRRRISMILPQAGDCNVDCDDGGGGPGDECTCS
ncbi:MAG: hypothetical protein J2P17_10325, partial [Mycobacterium sp.]|nr:hypothetical protein [Mycobacterium sp.]